LCDEGLIDSSAMNWTVGQIGCALSHRTAWSQCLEADRPLLVFEDDAMAARCWYQKAHELLVGFAQTEWDLVLLGWNFDSCLQLEWAPGHRFTALFRPRYPSLEELEIALQQSSLPQCFRLNTALGLAGYLVSPGGALKLLEWAFPLRTLPIVTPELPQRQCFSLDGQLNALYSEINAYICFPPLAVGINDQGVSLTRV
jgi:GR25 family glycosyltransferase involved in LPS biosynthesis